MATTVEMAFEVGQRVMVNPTHYDHTPAWEGTILGYHRNGDWWVREDKFHTYAAHHVSRLTPVEIEGDWLLYERLTDA